jgi:hypothetical protein
MSVTGITTKEYMAFLTQVGTITAWLDKEAMSRYGPFEELDHIKLLLESGFELPPPVVESRLVYAMYKYGVF